MCYKWELTDTDEADSMLVRKLGCRDRTEKIRTNVKGGEEIRSQQPIHSRLAH